MYIKNEFSIITFSIAIKYLHFHQNSANQKSKWKKDVEPGLRKRVKVGKWILIILARQDSHQSSSFLQGGPINITFVLSRSSD